MSILDIKVPSLGESVVEATIARWTKKPGDVVRLDELLVEIETDKVTLEITSPATGILESIICPQGAIVRIGDSIGKVNGDVRLVTETSAPSLSLSSEKGASQKQEAPSVVSSISAPSVEPTSPSMPLSAVMTVTEDMIQSASPSVRKQLAERGLSAQDVRASRLDGRLTKEDILSGGGLNVPHNTASLDREESRVPMSRLRQRIAERLKDAQNTAAILTTFNEIDMTAVKQLRDRYKDAFEKEYHIKLGFMSFFIKACVKALQDIPMINSRIEGNEIITSNYCDIGVAVSAPNGLVVPIIRDADLMDLADIERTIAGFGKKAKENKLSIDDMTGGTFTISNGGVFGSLLSTPILNPPQSAILGMHKVQDRPVALNGRIEIRPMMYVALSYDHRLVDGREAVTFLVSIKESIENPGRFLLGL